MLPVSYHEDLLFFTRKATGIYNVSDHDPFTHTGLFPVRTTKDGGWEIVQGLPVDAFSREKIDATVNELKEERDAVSSLLKH